ncbi:type II toxin-antitoxin system YhaV family toxin [Aromatoleum toluclasticum]|uniref:type II toxin-antitoxin system YhaV family toxin n=1 Tax=Aromatoleum toluclasticum TaxID=92003 RepID=UPI003F68D821
MAQWEAGANGLRWLEQLTEAGKAAVPSDPARDEFRQGNTLGPAYRHWRRAKIGRRFRVFFRYDSKTKVLVFAWDNDEQTLLAVDRLPEPERLAPSRHQALRDAAPWPRACSHA